MLSRVSLCFRRLISLRRLNHEFPLRMLSTEPIAQVTRNKPVSNGTKYINSHSRYQEAIATLNTLQNTAQVIATSLNDPVLKRLNANRTKHYLSLIGIDQDQVNTLNMIHVTGTKGKGSTCAFTESILRHHGYKTGLFTSPHLISVRERIRVNGKPIQEDVFVHYFWKTINGIRSKESESISNSHPPLPSYPMFLVCMGINVFLNEGVEAAVLEVGVGGEYDCTNFITRPVVTGITSLGLDHTVILGDTIDQIAWQKSGIFKPNVPAFTVEQDNEIAMNVLIERAIEKQASSLTKVPPLNFSCHDVTNPCCSGSSSLAVSSTTPSIYSSNETRNVSTEKFVDRQRKSLYCIKRKDKGIVGGINYCYISFTNEIPDMSALEEETVGGPSTETVIPLGIPGSVQKLNASLAIQLSHVWLKKRECVTDGKGLDLNGNIQEESFILPRQTLEGLANCRWPGRYQVVPNVGGDADLTFFLDGAHTKESIDLCATWFAETSVGMETSDSKVFRVLLFNLTGRRNPSELMLPLVSCHFLDRKVIFDSAVFSPNRVLREMSTTSDQSNFLIDSDLEAKKSVNLSKLWVDLSKDLTPLDQHIPVSEAVSCLSEAVSFIQRMKQQLVREGNQSRVHIHVLVTGSLHLVGGVLGIIDPELTSFKLT